MKGLKTLKDIEFRESEQLELINHTTFQPVRKSDNEKREWVNHNNLKQEAMKWMMDDEHCSNDDPCEHCEGTINFIKHFFNITDEEIDDFCVEDVA